MSNLARRGHRAVATWAFIGLALSVVAAGCGGRDATGSVAPDAPRLVSVKVDSTSLTGTVKDTTYGAFILYPMVSATYMVSNVHRLSVRANGVCDLGSTYGPAYWDTPCAVLTHVITVGTKSWTDAQGHPHVDFQPALRFVPSPEAAPSAVLYLKDKVASKSPSAVMFYCNDAGCLDEGGTQRDAIGGWVYRQIKHFSGYVVGSSREDTTFAP